MVFVEHPFPSAGRVVRAQIRALRTTGTLLLGIFRQTSGVAGTCGSFERVRQVSIPRTTEGIDVVSSTMHAQSQITNAHSYNTLKSAIY
jgi:hypothetical protein